jgi:acyl-CoA reductase-like NAD-dependent aldehyde dehydrogenase
MPAALSASQTALDALVVLLRSLPQVCAEALRYWHCILSSAALAGLGWLLLRTVLLDAPRVEVPLTEEEREDVLPAGRPKYDPAAANVAGVVHCWDPSTMVSLGTKPADDRAAVIAKITKARAAQAVWGASPFAQRRRLMRTLRRHIVENMASIARVAVRDSGKTVTDAMFGEILVTCEKLKWLAAEGEAALAPERRKTGTMMMTKRVRVEYAPLGVIGAIVPWNYPFHNVFNPMIAALFSGNAIVIKVSEYASWSSGYYARIIDACLAAVGAPAGLVQFVTGFAEAGSAVVTGGVDKVIFVGSPEVGALVMAAAAPSLTPVVLELGGKDPFVVCEDMGVGAALDDVVQIACRGVFQNMGQNCAGPERFIVLSAAVHDAFVAKAAAIVNAMAWGRAPLGDAYVDCGAVTMGRSPQMVGLQALVDDAVAKGATLAAGGVMPSAAKVAADGQFYPPTVLANVPRTAMIAQQEIFGPIMCVFKVEASGAAGDDAAVALANDCEFALSSCAFAASQPRAAALAARLRAGMSAVNDIEGTTYLSQSLPFGGAGKSGFDRFAGPEGLRGLCLLRSVCEDNFSGILPRTSIPPPLQYPSTGRGAMFSSALVRMFYGHGPLQKLLGVVDIVKAVAGPPAPRAAADEKKTK